jgi:transcriptional regulator with XRE-family HTH domain
MASKKTPSPPPERMEDRLARAMGAALKAARLRAGLTQAQAAEKVGLAAGVYGRLERGGMMPSVQTLRRISAALKVPSDTLLGLTSSEVTAWVDAVPEAPQEPAELRRLSRNLRKLSTSDLKVLHVVALALAR